MQVLRCRDEDARRTVWSTGIRASLLPFVVIPAKTRATVYGMHVLQESCVVLMWHMPLNRDTTDILFHAADAW
jgi:hypothetical protein